MFNLFNGIYLDLADRFTSKYDYLTVSTTKTFHPAAKYIEQDFGESPAFDDYLEENFDADEDRFWQSLINKEKKKSFVIYTDSELYHRLQLTFFKNIFPKSEIDQLHRLYNFYVYNEHIRSKLQEKRGGENLRVDTKHLPHYTEEEFEQKLKQLPKHKSLYSMDKASLCFEFLFLQYVIERDCVYSAYFLKRVKDLSWKNWFEEIGEIRTEIINGFYQLDKILDDSKFSLDENLDSFLAKNNLEWISDLNLYGVNPDYFKRTYKPDDFLKIINAKDKIEFSSDQDFSDRLTNNFKTKMEYLFSERYEDLLLLDVKDSIGCSFTKGQMQAKVNTLLLSYLYSVVDGRNSFFGETLTLSETKLSQDE